jgi:flagellin-like hook-associated protein FlgL
MSIGLHTDASGSAVARLAGSFVEATNQTQLKLSSGNRMVSSYDDAGAYSVSEKMSATIKHKLASYHNLQSGLSFLQSQDSVLGHLQKIIKRMMVLKTRYSDVIKTASDKAALDHEFEDLQDQIASMKSEKFNGISLFDMKPVADSFGFAMVDPNHALTVDTNDEGTGQIEITRHGVFENFKAKYGPDGLLNTGYNRVKAAYDGGDGGTGSNSVLPTVKFSGGGGGVGAAATITVNDIEGDPFQGKVTSVTLTNPGTGYTSNPTVAISGMNGGAPSTVTAIVDVVQGSPTEGQILRLEGTNSGEVLSYNSAVGSATPPFNTDNFIRSDGGTGYTGATAYAYVSADTSGVQNVSLDIAGKGYAYDDSAFSVTFENGGGFGAKASANIVNGEVVGLNLIDGGQDYNPADFTDLGGAMVSFTGGGGRGAKFIAQIDAATKKISGFTKLDGGADYTSAPTVRIASAGGYNGTGEPALTTIQTSPTGTQIIDTSDDPITIDPHASVFGTTVAVSGSATANAVIEYDPTSANFGKVTQLNLINGGSGYGAAPAVTITGPGGNTSANYVALLNGLTAGTLLSGGAGFDSSIQLQVTGGGGTGATATASLTDDGSGITFSVASINITNPGSGYTSAPTISVKAGTGGGGGGFASAAIVGTGQVTGFKKGPGANPEGSGYAPTAYVAPDDPSHPDSVAATLKVIVENDQTNADFGKVTAFTIIDGGRGYVDDSSLRTITATLGGATVTGKASNDPGELSFLMDDNGTPNDDTDDVPIIFQKDTHGYDTHGTGYSKVPDVVISAPTFNTAAFTGKSVQAGATATTNEGEVQAIASTNPGTGFAETASLSVGGATGLGANILVGAVDVNTGTLQSISMDPAFGGSPGSGYQVGDPIIFTGNGHGSPQAEVASVDPVTGEILTFSITNGGSGFQPLAVNVDAPPTGAGGVTSVGAASVDSSGQVTAINLRHHGFAYDRADGNPDGDVSAGGDPDPTVKIGDDTENWEFFGGNPISAPDYVDTFVVGRHEPGRELNFTRRDENGIVHTTGSWRHDPGPDGLYQFPASPPHGLNSTGQGNDVYEDETVEQYAADYDNNNDLLNPLFNLVNFSIRDFADYLETLSSARSINAASSQRITLSINNILQNHNDLEAAHGRITQVDLAHEMTRFKRNEILSKSTLAFSKSASEMHRIALTLLKEGL